MLRLLNLQVKLNLTSWLYQLSNRMDQKERVVTSHVSDP